jgi:hypothetical protein
MRADAQEEANCLNVINQSVIGAKEGAVEAITELVGSDITDAILRTADGSDHKSVDDYTLFEVIQVAINGADRPSTNDILEQLLVVINHTFNFGKKVSVNMELLQLNAACMATYGIIISIPQLMLTLLGFSYRQKLVKFPIYRKHTFCMYSCVCLRQCTKMKF